MRSWLGRGKSLRAGVTVCCLLAFVLFGYEQGVFGPILQNQDWLDLFNHPSDSQTGIIVSCYNLGCFLGCVLSFIVGERLGRRRTIWVAMVFVLVGTTLQATSFRVAHLIVGRVVTGVGTGMKTATVPMYQSELCPPTRRGRLVSAEVLFVGVGIVTAYWFNFGMSYVEGPIAWRLPVAAQAIFAIGVIILVFALPESPRWLFNHGQPEEAIAVLCAVYDKDEFDEVIVTEKNAIVHALETESEAKSESIISIFKHDKFRTGYRVFLGWLIQLMNQVSGINMVVYYIPSVLEGNVGMTVRTSQIVGGCVNMMLMFSTLVPSFYLDRMGRRKTMMAGCTGLGLCMMMISALLSQSDGGMTARGTNFASASVAFFFLYMGVFGMSVHCVPWVYVPEILPLKARTRGTAIGISSNWIWNFTVVMITPIIINRLKWQAYLIFMATNLSFVPLIYFLFPETGNLRLEDIDYIFSDGRNPVLVAKELTNNTAVMANIREEQAAPSKDNEGGVETIEQRG